VQSLKHRGQLSERFFYRTDGEKKFESSWLMQVRRVNGCCSDMRVVYVD